MANRQFAFGLLFKYSIDVYNDVKVNGNMSQSLTLPWRENIDKANLVEINGKYYDIISLDNNTFYERNSILTILYNPICSLLAYGDALGGWFERTPELSNPGEPMNIGTDTLTTSSVQRFSNIAPDTGYMPENVKPFFVLITARHNLRTSETSDLAQYGAFIPYSPYSIGNDMGDYYEAAYGLRYPDIHTIMTDIDSALDIPANSVVNVAISARCPYRHIWIPPVKYELQGPGGNPFSAIETDPVYHWALTQLSSAAGGPAENPTNNQTQALSLNDFERFCGRISIIDELGNEIAIIPNEWFTRQDNGSHVLHYNVRSVGDYTGLYTIIQIKDRLFTLPEGQLPWVGDAWANYAQYQMQYDREAAERAMDRINAEKTLNQANMAASALMSVTNPASAISSAASLGVGLATAEMSANISKGNIYADQVAKEGLIKSSPASNYQTAYGLDYCWRSYILGGANIRVETPTNLNAGDFTNYIKYRGWPCNKYTTIAAREGYIKGNVFNIPNNTKYNNASGPELDALRRELASGLRMVYV